jgi:hypothetical protein
VLFAHVVLPDVSHLDARNINRNWLTLLVPSEVEVEKAGCCSAHRPASP